MGSGRSYRLTAIDMLRGLAIVVMAVDHVRDYFLAGTSVDPTADPNVSAGLFAARWITHFCAPVFVLLAGTSAGLMAGRKSRSELARFLFTRGVWLIAVEILVIATAWSLAPGGIAEAGGRAWTSMQVIWAIGASMVALSGLQWLGRNACLALGVAVVAAHNLLDPIWPASQLLDQQWPLWVALHSPMSLPAGPFLFVFRYPLLPWIGVMLLGFGVSRVFELPPARRNALLLRGGVVLTLGFLLLRASGIYGDPNPWQVQPGGLTATVIDFLNVTKYPPSLLFLLMTLGPAAIVCAVADRSPRCHHGCLRQVRPRAVCVLRGAPLPDSPVERAPGHGPGVHPRSDDDDEPLLPKRLWCGTASRLCRLGVGGGSALSGLPLGHGREGASLRLVAKLRLRERDPVPDRSPRSFRSKALGQRERHPRLRRVIQPDDLFQRIGVGI